jgi:hypothetical protein
VDHGRFEPGRPGHRDRRGTQPGAADPAGREGALAPDPQLGDQHRPGVRPKKNRGRGALHPPAGELHGDLRRRARAGSLAHLPARAGLVAGRAPDQAPLEYSRGPDKTWVYGGLPVGDGQAITLYTPSCNCGRYQRFLQQAEDANPRGQIVIITDNLSSHYSKATRAWLEDHPGIRHAFIPRSACWLNVQEGWWRIFRKTALAGQTFVDPDEIAHATRVATA